MSKKLSLSLALVTVLFLALALAAVGATFADTGQDPEPAVTPTGILDGIVPTRTPGPTNTPDAVAEEVERLTEQIGLDFKVLGLSGADWINLGISVLYVLGGYLVGTLLIRRLLPRLALRTPSRFDDEFLEAVGSEVRWLVVILTLQFGTQRLPLRLIKPR